MKTLAITNQKGGVGKTTAVLNIGAALAGMGRRVLLVDLDASADLTYTAGIDLTDDDSTVYDVLTGKALVADTAWTLTDDTGSSYDVLPADGALVGLAEAMQGMAKPQLQLRRALHASADDYDYVLLDTPPSADMASVQALTAADGVLAPAQPHALSVTALTNLANTMHDMHGLNPELKIDGVLLTNYNPRSTHHREIRDAIAHALPGRLLDTTISTAVGVTEAAAARTNIFEYAKKNPSRRKMRALEQYREAAKEIVRREEGKEDGNS